MATSVKDWQEQSRREARMMAGFPWYVALGAAVLIGLAAATVAGTTYAVRYLSPPGSQALCDDAMARLMRAETMVELEREKFLVGSMRCRVEARLAELRPVGSVP